MTPMLRADIMVLEVTTDHEQERVENTEPIRQELEKRDLISINDVQTNPLVGLPLEVVQAADHADQDTVNNLKQEPINTITTWNSTY